MIKIYTKIPCFSRFFTLLFAFCLTFQNLALADSALHDERLKFLSEKSCVNLNQKQCQQNKNFIKEYLKPVYCLDNEAESRCLYTLKKPLRLQGFATIKRDYQAGACDALESIIFEAQDAVATPLLKNLRLNISPGTKNYNTLVPHIQEWFQNNLSGEIVVFLHFEANTTFLADYSPCGGGNVVESDKIEAIQVNKTKIYGRENYENTAEYDSLKIVLASNRAVSLYDKPNGKVIAHINPKDSSRYLLWYLGWDMDAGFSWMRGKRNVPGFEIYSWQELIGHPLKLFGGWFSQTNTSDTQWAKVLYFPPNVESAEDAKVGYIKKRYMQNNNT